MGNPNKENNKEQGDGEAASAESITSPQDAHHTNRDLCQEREAKDATLAMQVAEQLQGRWPRLMRTTRPYSMTAQLQFPPALR